MTRSHQILLVTADKSVRNRIQSEFGERSNSFEILTATYTTEVIDLTGSRSIDCIVSTEPIRSDQGMELVQSVRNENPAIPFVLFTSDCTPADISTALTEGITQFVPRAPDNDPYSLLAEQVQRIIDRYRTCERAKELTRITTVIRELDRALVQSQTKDEIDQRVCEIFSESEPYHFAWIGEQDPETDRVEPRASAGVESGYLEEIDITAGEESTGQGPTGEAIRSREIEVMQNIPEDPRFKPWRSEALERGYKSSAAIPLVFEEMLFGVLNVYADRVSAFEQSERELLQEVGENIAAAYHRVQLRSEERRLQRAVEQAEDAIFITDTDGKIRFVNPAFEDLTGYKADEAIGRSHRILKSGEMDESYYEDIWDTILSGQSRTSEIINERKSGERYYVEETVAPLTDVTGDIEGFVGIQHDVTGRKRREQELKERKQKFEGVVENVKHGLVIVQDGIIKYTNPRVGEITGYEPEAVKGEALTMFVAEEDQDAVMEKYRKRVEGKPVKETYEIDLVPREGERIPVEISVGIIEHEGRPATISAIRDITERKERLKQIQMVDRILQHNFNNNMNVVQGYAEIIEDATTGEIASSASKILENSQKLLQTVEKERDVTEFLVSQQETTAVDVGREVEMLVSDMRERHPDAEISTDIQSEVTVRAVPEITRAIEEVLQNAITHADTDSPRIEVQVDGDDETLQISVSDNNPHIPEMERKVLLEDEDVAPLYHGSGIGLWLVNLIVAHSDGVVEVEATKPRGNEVTIQLPVGN
ncbi:PAS domain S-box protein [Halanaeroarchaeum sulfurireducens]|uniref:PAS/PAC sensor signal transduction histidine kinase n=1 Tax=Halanaeroarchaeum sulfurireducens TaxID=1604004 RepID=A0A0F7PHJ6_9EURY|nr:PAS domain S-box protein [Halanaeroarchaeum sulfurireducens]AKH98708.1 PAS/PAC sensor signal transduction histidine kinase [Halanaeroarchaeum sulfurireducens]ALG83152.1 PAS/PAC sensor signal transduction histidine kinase [Halanaeroarchaeum sulfurireducens]